MYLLQAKECGQPTQDIQQDFVNTITSVVVRAWFIVSVPVIPKELPGEGRTDVGQSFGLAPNGANHFFMDLTVSFSKLVPQSTLLSKISSCYVQ